MLNTKKVHSLLLNVFLIFVTVYVGHHHSTQFWRHHTEEAPSAGRRPTPPPPAVVPITGAPHPGIPTALGRTNNTAPSLRGTSLWDAPLHLNAWHMTSGTVTSTVTSSSTAAAEGRVSATVNAPQITAPSAISTSATSATLTLGTKPNASVSASASNSAADANVLSTGPSLLQALLTLTLSTYHLMMNCLILVVWNITISTSMNATLWAVTRPHQSHLMQPMCSIYDLDVLQPALPHSQQGNTFNCMPAEKTRF